MVYSIDTVSGSASAIAGCGEPGFAGDSSLAVDASLAFPSDAVAHPFQSLVFVADTMNDCVRRVDLETFQIETWMGVPPSDGHDPLDTSRYVGRRAARLGMRDHEFEQGSSCLAWDVHLMQPFRLAVSLCGWFLCVLEVEITNFEVFPTV